MNKNLYLLEDYQEILRRIEKLGSESQPEWGSMSAAQMLAHCAEIQEVFNGKELKNTPLLAKVFKGVIRNMVVNEKPYPKNTRTHPQYKQTTERDFASEKKRLLEALDRFVSMTEEEVGQIRHPLFGTMSTREKGWSTYKHLDHHLNQFGV